ncbi:sterol desaturase family protein [bacterium]|nr:sterol desaturase family protein [bacterium]NUN44318.1 sterol desaturase family protein [bacterium]
MSNTSLAATVLVLVGAVIIIGLERIKPYDARQHFFRQELVTDFFYYNAFQSFILGLVISAIIGWLDTVCGRIHIPFFLAWPFLGQLAFFLVLHDFYIYWFHRWQHRITILWRIHEAHHSARSVDWVSGMRSHALEILINQTIEFAPIVLLGASPEIIVWKAAIDAIWGMYIHSNINVKSGRLQYLINGPEMHRWHHAVHDTQAYNKNFSTKLAMWDWMFGTAFFPKDRKPEAYGLDHSHFPNGFFRQFLYAFRKS